MTEIKLYLLGRFRAVRDANEIHLPRRKVESLIAFLALRPEPHTRSELMTLLWGDSPDSRARHSLRTALATLRQHLGSEIIRADLNTLQLNADVPLWVDVREMLRIGSQPLDPGRFGFENLKDNLASYRDELLAGFYDEWIAPERERLRGLTIQTLLRFTREMRSRSEYDHAIELAQMVLATDPSNERAHQHLMFCHMAHGDRAAALAQYEACVRSLRHELGVTPAADTTALYLWAKQAPTEHERLEARITNLPIPMTSFVGRKRETTEIKRLLGMARLVTLTGAGGSGKTRLAIQVATDLLDTHKDGVWWVELAALTDEERLPEAIATAFGIQESHDQSLSKTIAEFLRSRRLLLVLDNCEHMLSACAALVTQLLSTCPSIQILATSREALNILGETIYLVPTLPSPDSWHLSLVNIMLDYDGVRLFVERAAAASPGFTLATDNVMAVAEICFRLDGIPLAIELAAARARLLSVQQIAERLDDRFNLLNSGNRGALPRHQTLRAAIDWSYDSLNAPEQTLFRRLAVFAGGFTQAAAEQICCQDLRMADILPILLDLANKSLVICDERQAHPRYRVLETIRQYAQEKLAPLAESADIRRRHLEYFLEVAETARPHLDTADRNTWLARLEADWDNLQVALQTAAEIDPADMELRLVGALATYWVLRAPYSLGRVWLEHAMRRVATPAGRAARASVLYGAGILAGRQDEIQTAIDRLAESVAIRRGLGDLMGVAEALSWQGLQWLEIDHAAAAQPLEEESVALFRSLLKHDNATAASGLAMACHFLGRAYHQQGNLAASRPLYEESLKLSRDVHDQWKMSLPLLRLGHLAKDLGDLAEARRWFEEALAVRRETGDRLLIANALSCLGHIDWAEGDLGLAGARFREVLPLVQAIGHKGSIKTVVVTLANLALDQSKFQQAAQLYAAAGEMSGIAENDPLSGILLPELLDARVFAELRQELGDDGFAAQWALGKARPLDEILD